MLGHSSLNVTAVYLQFNDQDIKELYDKTLLVSFFFLPGVTDLPSRRTIS